MSNLKVDYFSSEASSPLSVPSSSRASPNASSILSPGSSSVATSQLSLLAFESQGNSPATSACTSVSDGCSEADKLSLENSSQAPRAEGEQREPTEDSEAAAVEAESRRVEEELDSALAFGAQIVQREARALAMAAKRLSKLSPQQDGFREAVRLVLRATNGERGGKVVLTGVGKSGIIAKKLSATFLSLGTPSMFLHPTEALHGDLGLLTPHRDVVIALSHSGSSPEILALVPHLNARKCPIIALVGKRESALVKASDAWIDCATGKDDDSDDEEDEEAAQDNESQDAEQKLKPRSRSTPNAAKMTMTSTAGTDNKPSTSTQQTRRASSSSSTCECGRRTPPHSKRRSVPRPTTDEAWDDVPAPSSSTTVALAMGDALAFSVTRAKGLGRDMFAFNHPGGKLGADFRLQGQSVPLQSYDAAKAGDTSAVATPIAA